MKYDPKRVVTMPIVNGRQDLKSYVAARHADIQECAKGGELTLTGFFEADKGLLTYGATRGDAKKRESKVAYLSTINTNTKSENELLKALVEELTKARPDGEAEHFALLRRYFVTTTLTSFFKKGGPGRRPAAYYPSLIALLRDLPSKKVQRVRTEEAQFVAGLASLDASIPAMWAVVQTAWENKFPTLPMITVEEFTQVKANGDPWADAGAVSGEEEE